MITEGYVWIQIYVTVDVPDMNEEENVNHPQIWFNNVKYSFIYIIFL